MCLHTCPAAIPLPFRFLRWRDPGAGNIVCGVMPYFSARPRWGTACESGARGGLWCSGGAFFHESQQYVWGGGLQLFNMRNVSDNKNTFDQCAAAPGINFKTSAQTQSKPNSPIIVEDVHTKSIAVILASLPIKYLHGQAVCSVCLFNYRT